MRNLPRACRMGMNNDSYKRSRLALFFQIGLNHEGHEDPQRGLGLRPLAATKKLFIFHVSRVRHGSGKFYFFAWLADVYVVSIEPQRLRATKTTPVASLGGMIFVNPSLAADPLRPSGLFLFLAHGRQRARKRNVFFPKNHRKTGITK